MCSKPHAATHGWLDAGPSQLPSVLQVHSLCQQMFKAIPTLSNISSSCQQLQVHVGTNSLLKCPNWQRSNFKRSIMQL